MLQENIKNQILHFNIQIGLFLQYWTEQLPLNFWIIAKLQWK